MWQLLPKCFRHLSLQGLCIRKRCWGSCEEGLLLVMLANGDWCNHGRLIHYCHPGCCRDDAFCQRRFCAAFCAVLFKAKPQVSMLSRWTRVGPCVDFYIMGLAVHNVLAEVVRAAFPRADGIGREVCLGRSFYCASLFFLSFLYLVIFILRGFLGPGGWQRHCC